MDLLTQYQRSKELGLIENETQSSCHDQETLRLRITQAYRDYFKPVVAVTTHFSNSEQVSLRGTRQTTPAATRSHSPTSNRDMGTIASLKARIADLEKKSEEAVRFSENLVKERDELLLQVKGLKVMAEPSRVLERVVGKNDQLKLEIYKQQIAALTAEVESLKKS